MSFNMKRAAALGLTGLMAATTILSGCGSSGSSSSGDDATSFTMLTTGTVDNIYYSDYDENPSAQYWLLKEWDADGDGEGTTISIDFTMPVEGSESDYVNTLMATGEYPDILGCPAYVSDSAVSLYEDGVILDLTDYIKDYMPNLQAWLDAHPTYLAQIATEVDGEQRILYLPTTSDVAEDAWGSYCYRRDWIAKYGTNPETGEPFTYEWTTDEEGNRVMVDDIVFPSGNTDPYYISDWEWMFDIFAKAIDDLGIEEGYCMQLTSGGISGTGDLDGGFGGTMGYQWYIKDDGTVECGMTTKYARAYIECVSNWYANGWVNSDFEENVGELWFSCDTDHVYTGQVGMWYGLVSQWGNSMDDGSDYLKDVYIAAAPQPINDIYGDEDCQNKEPICFYENSLASKGAYITNKAEDKDLATLFTALDWLYSTEGGLVRYLGLSDKMLEELEADGHDDITQIYRDNGVDGCYSESTDADGNTVYVKNPVMNNKDDSLKVALNLVRIFGYSQLENIDYGRTEEYQHNQDLANMYDATAAIGMLPDKLSSDDQADKSLISTNISTYTSQAIPDFITGRTELNDENWDAYVAELQELGCDKVTDMLNAAAGN